MPEERITKNDRRQAARDKAAAAREERQKRQKRRRIIIQSSIITGILAVVVIAALLITNGIGAANRAAINAVGPKNMASGGITLTSTTKALATPASKNPVATKAQAGKLKVQIVLDYQCPFCKAFEARSSDYIAQLLNSGKITYEIHPVVFLSNYSLRAANAAACVANREPNSYWAYNQILYANQPEEGGSTTLSNRQLADLAQRAGISDAQTLTCIRAGDTYDDWVSGQTTYAATKGILGSDLKKVESTPTVIINGKVLSQEATGTQANFQAAMEAAAKAQGITL